MEDKARDLLNYEEIVDKALQVLPCLSRVWRVTALIDGVLCVAAQEERALEALALQLLSAPKSAASRCVLRRSHSTNVAATA